MQVSQDSLSPKTLSWIWRRRKGKRYQNTAMITFSRVLQQFAHPNSSPQREKMETVSISDTECGICVLDTCKCGPSYVHLLKFTQGSRHVQDESLGDDRKFSYESLTTPIKTNASCGADRGSSETPLQVAQLVGSCGIRVNRDCDIMCHRLASL